MKKILLILLVFAFLIQGTGVVLAERTLTLSDTTKIEGTMTDNHYAKVSSSVYHGESGYSLHLYTTGENLEFSQPYTQALAAGTYTLTWYIKGKGRLDFYSNWGTEFVSTVTVTPEVQSDGWTKYTTPIEIDGNGDTKFLFYSNGAVDCYIDDISIVDENGVNYIKDGGFEEVTIEGQEPEEPNIPEESEDNLILSDTTKIEGTMTDTHYAKVSGGVYHGDSGYSLHLYTTGENLEFSQPYTQALTAGTYTLTWYIKGKGRLDFYSNWGTEFASTVTVTPEVQSDSWTKYTTSIEIDGNGDTKFLFYSNGAVDCYIDDISLVDENGINYIKDGGFEEVTIEGQDPEEPNIPEESEDNLILSDTTKIEGTMTDTHYAKVSGGVYHGDSGYSLHLYTTGENLEFSQPYTQALTAGTYTLTWYIKGKGRLDFYSNWGTEFASTVTVTPEVQSDSWTKYTTSIEIDGNGDTKFLFYSDGAVDCYIDDISLVDENGINYIKDGGFEEVTIEGQDPEEPTNPEEPIGDLILSNTTKIEGTMTDTHYAKVSGGVYHGESGYSLHLYTTGENLEFGQSYIQTLTAGTYTLTWYIKGKGRLDFYSNWGTEFASTVTVTPEVQSDGWTKYTTSIEIDGNGDNRFLFYSDGAVDCYIDDISLVDENGVNYIKDGGFEEVTVIMPEIPDYEVSQPILKKGIETVEAITETGTYTVLVNAKNNALDDGLECELLVAVFNQNGEMEYLRSSKDNFEKTPIRAEAEELSVTFEITSEGQAAEVYLINNRQNIELYYDPVKY